MIKFNYWCNHDYWINVRGLDVLYLVWNNTYQWKYSIQLFNLSNYVVPKYAITFGKV